MKYDNTIVNIGIKLMSQQNKSRIIDLIIIVLISTVATTGTVLVKGAQDSKIVSQPNIINNSSTTTTPTTTNSGPASTSSALTYKDGTYTANGSFYTPDGAEQIGVTVTLTSGNISSVKIDDSTINNGTSLAYTERFINGINLVVVGQNIDSVNVGRISGASLTPMGFNNAIDTIKNNAKA
jgi:uncharacterized protein with FMN-binding domain